MTALTPAQKDRQRRARARVYRIREGMRNYIHTLGDVRAAWDEGDWKTLGYASWEAYLAQEFSADMVRLPPEQRQKAIDELRLSGMSNRAIGAVLNVSEATVRRDSAATNVAPIEGEIVDPPARSPLVEAITGAIEDADTRNQTAGLAGPAPDAEQASVASGTAGGGADIPPSAAPQDPVLPGREGVGAPENSSHAQGFSGEEPGESAGTGPSAQGGPATSPAGPPCEKCGNPIATGQAAEGYTRCDPCDPDGDHVDHGDGCRGCRVVAETDPAYVLSFGENEHGLHLECGECDGFVAHLKPGGGLPEALAAARDHYQICGATT